MPRCGRVAFDEKYHLCHCRGAGWIRAMRTRSVAGVPARSTDRLSWSNATPSVTPGQHIACRDSDDTWTMSYQGFISRLSQEEHDFYEIKNAAAEFYRVNRVPEEIERALNELFFHKPEDLHGYLANYFTKLSAPPRISRVKGREVYDAKGQLTVEAEVFCIICNKEQSMSSASISSHFGPKETSLQSKERGDHVMTAVQWINQPLNNLLKDQNPCDQSKVDLILSDFFMACYLEEKNLRNREREESRSPESDVVLPSPPPAQTKDKKGVDKVKKSNTAEKPFHPPEPAEPVLLGSLAIGSVSLALAKTGAQIQGIPLYKYIAALQNQEDTNQWEKLSNVIGDSCSLLSDITYKPQAPPLPGVRGHILKHMNETTVSDLIRITSEQQVSKEKHPPPLFPEEPQEQSPAAGCTA
eukprot:superscaffoldBa00000045_g791